MRKWENCQTRKYEKKNETRDEKRKIIRKWEKKNLVKKRNWENEKFAKW